MQGGGCLLLLPGHGCAPVAAAPLRARREGGGNADMHAAMNNARRKFMAILSVPGALYSVWPLSGL